MNRHPHAELAAYAAGDLPGGERAAVEEHVVGCRECQAQLADQRALLARLAAAVPAPPEVAWARYRAEVRARRAAAPRPFRRARWLTPVPIAAAAAVVAALIAVVFAVGVPGGRLPDLAAVEHDGLAGRLELIDNYRVVDQLDLLEDLDVIRNLDRLGSTREG